MIGVIGLRNTDRGRRCARNFGSALFECVLEAGELIPYALVLFFVGLGLYLLTSTIFHLMFDPNAVDVASRLDALSIDPNKWFQRS